MEIRRLESLVPFVPTPRSRLERRIVVVAAVELFVVRVAIVVECGRSSGSGELVVVVPAAAAVVAAVQ